MDAAFSRAGFGVVAGFNRMAIVLGLRPRLIWVRLSAAQGGSMRGYIFAANGR